MAPPGPPLPVLDVINALNPAGGAAAVYFGVSIDWKINDPENFNKDLGHNAAIQDGYYYISSTLERAQRVNSSGIDHTVPDYFEWTSHLIAGTGAIMGITLLPHYGLDNISQEAIVQLGAKCAEINQMGVPIMLRFAPEMNGNWWPWGQDPVKYRSVFRRLALVVRNMTGDTTVPGNGTALPVNGTNVTSVGHNGNGIIFARRAQTAIVWAPAPAQRYPYNETVSRYSPAWNTSRWIEMDTNKDGVVNELDDPYLPYYPGDDVVDWVGVTAIHYGPVNSTTTNGTGNAHTNTTLTPLNALPPVGNDPNGTSFESMVTGATTQWNFYETFSKGKTKPMVISETGIAYYVNQPPGPGELAMKQTWWKSLYNITLLKTYPLIRAVVWYDQAATEYGENISYALTLNTTILSAFQFDINSLPTGTLIYANETIVPSNGTMLANGTFVNGTMFNGTLSNGTQVFGAWVNGTFVNFTGQGVIGVSGGSGAGNGVGVGAQGNAMAANGPHFLHGGQRTGANLNAEGPDGMDGGG
ncbi:hypothetical protein HK104_006672 [Borealophlyctis nickersoniae]|nr:hypothetical protein HK104_006672 [Borealophlyctis nickersoniae]